MPAAPDLSIGRVRMVVHESGDRLSLRVWDPTVSRRVGSRDFDGSRLTDRTGSLRVSFVTPRQGRSRSSTPSTTSSTYRDRRRRRVRAARPYAAAAAVYNSSRPPVLRVPRRVEWRRDLRNGEVLVQRPARGRDNRSRLQRGLQSTLCVQSVHDLPAPDEGEHPAVENPRRRTGLRGHDEVSARVIMSEAQGSLETMCARFSTRIGRPCISERSRGRARSATCRPTTRGRSTQRRVTPALSVVHPYFAPAEVRFVRSISRAGVSGGDAATALTLFKRRALWIHSIAAYVSDAGGSAPVFTALLSSTLGSPVERVGHTEWDSKCRSSPKTSRGRWSSACISPYESPNPGGENGPGAREPRCC